MSPGPGEPRSTSTSTSTSATGRSPRRAPRACPGGLSAGELLDAAYLAGRDPRVRAVDITEVDAEADAPDGRTVRLAALCVLEAAAGLAGRTAR